VRCIDEHRKIEHIVINSALKEQKHSGSSVFAAQVNHVQIVLKFNRIPMGPSRNHSTRQKTCFLFELFILFSIIENLEIQIFSAFSLAGEK
jgi:hypothetical protein